MYVSKKNIWNSFGYNKGGGDIYFAPSVEISKSHQNKYPPTPTKGKENIKLLSLILYFPKE